MTQPLCMQDRRAPAVGALKIALGTIPPGMEYHVRDGFLYLGPYCQEHLDGFLEDARNDSSRPCQMISVTEYQQVMGTTGIEGSGNKVETK